MNIAILMLTHNACKYCIESIVGLKKTKLHHGHTYKLIVVDNKSGFMTRCCLSLLKLFGFVDCLYFNKQNDLFAGGNNIAAKFAAPETTHYLLLNSDINIKNPAWLETLISIHPANGGVSSLGAVMAPPIRADGYCFLIDKYLYDMCKLDENYQWWWAVTKLQSEILKAGYDIAAVANHENLIHHYGGKSGHDYTIAKGLYTDIEIIKSWFDKKSVKIIDNITLTK